MLIQDARPELRSLGEELFALAEELGARPTGPSGDWYRFDIAGAPALYFRLIGDRARSYPKNSVHLATKWSDDFATIHGVTRGNNWYGQCRPQISALVQVNRVRQRTREHSFVAPVDTGDLERVGQ